MEDLLTLDPKDEAGHWFLLNIAVGRQLGRPLFGPSAADVFAAPMHAWICDGSLESLIWHREHAAGSADGVLNACRGWRFVVCGEWGSKGDGAAWVLEQDKRLDIAQNAGRARREKVGLDPEEVAAFLRLVEERMLIARNDDGVASF